jgi:uncharacterized membrane protein YhaH (DUF805 family)
MEWYSMVWRKYADFNGRSRRKEYWMFVLINMIIYFVLYAAGFALMMGNNKLGVLLLVLCVVYGLAALLPSLAVAVRRLHDTNKGGLWILIALVPLIGGIWLLVLLATDGTPGDNQFGPNPKGWPAQPVTTG